MAERLSCQLCDRHVSIHNTFVCTTCACTATYKARFESAQALLQREALAREGEHGIRDSSLLAHDSKAGLASLSPSRLDEQYAATQRLVYDRLRSQRADVKSTTRIYDQTIQEMEDACNAMREDIRRRVELQEARRDTLKQGSSTLNQLKARADAINLSTAKIVSRNEPLQAKTAESRAFMVREAANLWGLTVKRKRGRDGKAREMAYIAGLPVPDLRDLLSARPEHLNASLIAIAYMLNQTCSYLGMRLPSQLLLPDKEHAWPRILPVHSSYNDDLNSGSETSSSLHRSQHHDPEAHPSAAKGVEASLSAGIQSRARPLHLQQPLMRLYADDALTYESFVEATSLLAYNIAWLAMTQGIDVCSRRRAWTWEGACDLGRNLWLLYGPSTRKSDGDGRNMSAGKDGQDEDALVSLGTFSHSTNRNNIVAHEAGILGLREWRLANPNSLIRRLKDALADRKMAGEWELLEEVEWGQTASPAEEVSNELSEAQQVENEKAAKGWQKLRPRT